MIHPRRAGAPGILHRVGRLPDPLDFPPWSYCGSGRFDDPLSQFRVLYATSGRLTALLETASRFRLSVRVLHALAARGQSLGSAPTTRIPPDWRARHGVANLRLATSQKFLDLRSIETREFLRRELSATLVRLGLDDIDAGAVLGPKRELTKAIARWAYDQGHNGLLYGSRLDARLSCWAIFEGATFSRLTTVEPIGPNDPDLIAAARVFELAI